MVAPIGLDFDRENRRNEVLRRRIAGESVREIAAATGLSAPTVAKVIRDTAESVLADRRRLAEEITLVQHERVELLVRRVLKRIVADPEAVPTKDELSSLLRLFERQAKLLGLDSPTKVEQEWKLAGTTPAEIAELAERYGIATDLDTAAEARASPRGH